jgi:hypothetical protein
MNLIKSTKNVLSKILTKKEDKLDILLDMIDSISVNNETNTVHIKTRKNLALENDGHMVVINSGMQVLLSKQIHLNPKVEFDVKEMDVLEHNLQETIAEEERLFEEQQKVQFLKLVDEDCGCGKH